MDVVSDKPSANSSVAAGSASATEAGGFAKPDMYSGAEDIYRELVEKSDQNWLLGLVAFAIVEEQRIEWMRHHESFHGSLPGAEEIRRWYQQQPRESLIRARGEAENSLRGYAEDVAIVFENDYRKEIQDDIIVDEIRQMKKFWPQLGVNVAGGLISAFAFSAILILLLMIVINDPSPVAIVKNLSSQQSSQGKNDGK